jgi:hypothetical protein
MRTTRRVRGERVMGVSKGTTEGTEDADEVKSFVFSAFAMQPRVKSRSGVPAACRRRLSGGDPHTADRLPLLLSKTPDAKASPNGAHFMRWKFSGHKHHATS